MCDLKLRLYILGRLPFFSGLPDSKIRDINALFSERGYAMGEIIYFEKSPAKRLYAVADGHVKLMRHTVSGKDVMLNVLNQGEFFGSLTHAQDDNYSETAHAHTPVCTLSIEGNDFRQILSRHPPVAIKVMDIMAHRLREAHEMVRLLSVSSIEQRLAHVLLKLGDKLGEADDVGLLIQLPLGRSDLAELTGTTTETASRVMSQLQKEGLIQTGRRWVAITNKPGLAALTEI
ncbi:MAG: Crp/Fnr family transcriptional regulator [Chloroflexi bacterium]|nr:Crp/Fnr family transcriptional regulator [Chloroflexota bacterium]